MWVFILSKLEKTAGLLEKSTICFFLFLACEVWVTPFIQLSPGRFAIIGRNILAQALQFGLYATMFLILYPKIHMVWKNRAAISKDRFLWILLVFVLTSTLWSIDPQVTLRSGLMLLVLTFFAVFLGVNYNWSEISSFFCLTLTIISFASVFIRHTTTGIIFDMDGNPWTGQVWSKGVSGVAGDANALGPLMALNVLLWLAYIFNKGKYSWLATLPIMLSLALLVLSNSKGALAAFLLTVAILILLNILRRFEHNFFLILVILSVWLAAGLLVLVARNLELLLGFWGRDLTLTGRTNLWIALWERLVRPHLFFGSGYAAFFQAGRYVGINTRFIGRHIGLFALGQAHNGFMGLLVDLGFVGLILFILSLFRNIIRAAKQFYYKKSTKSALFISLLMFLIFINITESNLLALNIYWILYVWISVCLSMKSLRA